MTTYTLFRNGQPIAQDEEGAGDLHAIGRPGDILLGTDPGDAPFLLAWHSGQGNDPWWVTAPLNALTPEMQLNLLLQQGTLPTGKALMASQTDPNP